MVGQSFLLGLNSELGRDSAVTKARSPQISFPTKVKKKTGRQNFFDKLKF